MNQNRIIAVLFLLFFWSCGFEKEIDYEVKNGEEKIVIHGFISHEQGIQAIVKKSLSPLNLKGNTYIDQPEVWLEQDGQPYSRLIETDSSLFASVPGLKLDPEKSYSIRVKAKGFPEARSTSQKMVSKLYFDTIFTTRISETTGKWYIALWIKDTENKDNYFSLNWWYFKDNERLNYNEGYQIIKYVYADTEFQGKVMKIEKDMPKPRQLYLEEEIDSIQFEIISVSKDYYLFEQSYSNYNDSYGDEYQEHVYPIKSNITGGYGFFCSLEKSTGTFKE